jgi:hypothetical protein
VFSTGEGKRAQYSIAKTDSNETPRVIFAEKDANASIEMIGDSIYAWTNAGAPNGRLLKAVWRSPSSRTGSRSSPSRRTWCLNHSW